MLIPMEAANSAVLAVFEQEVLHPNVTDVVVQESHCEVPSISTGQTAEHPTVLHERLKLLETEMTSVSRTLFPPEEIFLRLLRP